MCGREHFDRQRLPRRSLSTRRANEPSLLSISQLPLLNPHLTRSMPAPRTICRGNLRSAGHVISRRLLSSEPLSGSTSPNGLITESNTHVPNEGVDGGDLATRVLNLLRRTTSTKRFEAWSGVIQHLSDDRPNRKRIGILDLARSHKSTVIDSLIGDVNADTAIRDAIDMRWESVPASTNRIVIRDGPKVGRYGPVLELPSTVLGELNAELLEIRDTEHAADLLRADLPIIVMPPSTQGVPTILPQCPSALILLDSSLNQAISGRDEPSTSNISQLQFNRENPSPALSKIKEELSKININTSAAAMQRAAILAMLDECTATLGSLKSDLDSIEQHSRFLQKEVDSIIEHLNARFNSIDIDTELQDNKEALRRHIDSFEWFKVWEIDDIEKNLETGVATGYGTELERKLEWYAGCMAAAQERIKAITNEYIARTGPKLGSAQLMNRIEQMDVSSLLVPPSSFTPAIVQRRQTLANVSTPYLERRFTQRVYSVLLAMPVAGGVPTILWASEFWSASFAIPVALLGLLFGVRHISGAWEKGYKKRWRDYDRIQRGLSHDIRKVVDQTLEMRLRTIPRIALEESNRLVSQQGATIQELAKEAADAKEELDRHR